MVFASCVVIVIINGILNAPRFASEKGHHQDCGDNGQAGHGQSSCAITAVTSARAVFHQDGKGASPSNALAVSLLIFDPATASNYSRQWVLLNCSDETKIRIRSVYNRSTETTNSSGQFCGKWSPCWV